jgi:inner membrane protein
MLVAILALFMTIPSFFVSGLVDERAQRAENTAKQMNGNASGQQTFFGSSIREADAYQSVTRSLKYVLLFLGLVFLTYFVFEATSNKRVHPAQYILVGTAQIIFFLLLLSLAEKVGFDFAFLLAGGGTVALLSANAGWVFQSRLQGTRALAIFSLLYVLIYLLLRLHDDALLIGAISSFVAVAAAMYFTRGIDWYSQLALPGAHEQQPSILVPKDPA